MSSFEATPVHVDAPAGLLARRRLPGAAGLLSFILGFVAAAVLTHAMTRRAYRAPAVRLPPMAARLRAAARARAAMVGQPGATAARYYDSSYVDVKYKFCDSSVHACNAKCETYLDSGDYDRYFECDETCENRGDCVKCNGYYGKRINAECEGKPFSCAYDKATHIYNC